MTIDNKPSGSAGSLSARVIRSELGDAMSTAKLHLHTSIESTNTYLLQSSEKSVVEICAAEVQTQGRGRRGKEWFTPMHGVTFSMKLTVPVPLMQIGGGSLVCGVALCDTFHKIGVARAAVKWPNDILVGDAKLAGILVEIAAHSEYSTTLVVGIGINYRAGPEQQKIDRQIIDLHRLYEGNPPDRSQLIGKICKRVHADLSEALPLMPSFIDNWSKYDALAGQSVTVVQGSPGSASADSVTGCAAGIDERGYLLVETDQGPRSFSSAEVTIKKLAS